MLSIKNEYPLYLTFYTFPAALCYGDALGT